MNRREFLCATGSAAALGLSGGPGLARTLPEVGALHRLMEETPRERVAAELAALIRDGLDHRRTLAALAVATSRRVQPFPHVGFKYHTVLALQSVHLTTLALFTGPATAPSPVSREALQLLGQGQGQPGFSEHGRRRPAEEDRG